MTRCEVVRQARIMVSGVFEVSYFLCSHDLCPHNFVFAVDILGNEKMMEEFIRIATDFHSEAVKEDNIASEIREVAKMINSHPHGGLFKNLRR